LIQQTIITLTPCNVIKLTCSLY